MARPSASASVREDIDAQRAAWRALPSRLLVFLLACEALLEVVFLTLVFLNLRRTILFTAFNLDLEGNVPTGYAGFQLLFLSLGFLVLGSRLIPVRRRSAALRPMWLALGVLFAYLAIDEIGSVHERLPIWRLVVFNVPHMDPWMVMYATVGIVLLVLFAKQGLLAWRNWRKEVLLFIVGMATMVAGGLVLEGLNYQLHFTGVMRYVEQAFEEGFEMLGVSIMVYATYRVLAWVMTADPDSEATSAGL